VKLGGMPVNTKYGYTDIAHLQASLITTAKANATIFVSWEHAYLQKIVQNIMNAYGGGVAVPAWVSGDYDSLYVVRLTYTTDATGVTTANARFFHEDEGLNGQPTTCPF
jgi:hypothetical protein